jgi:excisionase family DNA binding protein
MTPTDADKLLSSHIVAYLLQSNPSSVNKWAADGMLPVYRTPGGHRRFKVGDVLAFAEKFSMSISGERLGAVLHG